jgi:hypothetical protein
MKRNALRIALLISITFLLGCTAVSEEDLVDATPIPEKVTYVEDVKSIIDNNCISCHSNPPQNGAPMPLVNFENVKDAIENRNLIGRISTEDPAFLMPFGGPRLPQNLIDIVIQWNEDGLIEE